MKQRKVSLPDDLLARLKLQSQQEGISESAIIRRALIRELQPVEGTSANAKATVKLRLP